MSDEYDSPWKEMLEVYFYDFLAFFFVKIHREVDWNRGYESLDKELERVVRDAESGRNIADKLIKVWRLDDEERVIFVHIEVQNEPEAQFSERIFCYNYRIFDRYRKPVVSLVVLGDDNPQWRPESFGWDLWDCRMSLRFPSVKLRDYNERWLELESNTNVFATLVMAHLKTRGTRKDPEERLIWKMRLVRRLYEVGYGRRDVLELFRFIDWLLRLPPPLEMKFMEQLNQFEEENAMRYVTSVERIGIQRGIREGRTSLLSRQLKRRFDELPTWVTERLEKASLEDLDNWAERVLDAQRLEDIFVA